MCSYSSKIQTSIHVNTVLLLTLQFKHKCLNKTYFAQGMMVLVGDSLCVCVGGGVEVGVGVVRGKSPICPWVEV